MEINEKCFQVPKWSSTVIFLPYGAIAFPWEPTATANREHHGGGGFMLKHEDRVMDTML